MPDSQNNTIAPDLMPGSTSPKGDSTLGVSLGIVLRSTFLKLALNHLSKNPVILVVWVASAATTSIFILELLQKTQQESLSSILDSRFTLQIAIWLWLTVIFANFAESFAEEKLKSRADNMRKIRSRSTAKRINKDGKIEIVASPFLRVGDIVQCESGDIIPRDGVVIEGVASVDESAITGESAPVIRETRHNRSQVTGGTRVISDSIKIEITANPGDTLFDRLLNQVENASHERTPKETSFLKLFGKISGLVLIIFTLIVILERGLINRTISSESLSISLSITIVICVVVSLIPTTISALLRPIGIANLGVVLQNNILAISRKAIERASMVDLFLLDKTGTITQGNRQAIEFLPLPNISIEQLAESALLSSMFDDTPEGRSIVDLARQKHGLKDRKIDESELHIVPFTPQTRMSGINLLGIEIRKGAVQSVIDYVKSKDGIVPTDLQNIADEISDTGGTPLAVTNNHQILGVIYLKDIVKEGLIKRFNILWRMQIKAIILTGDNPITVAAIAREVGVADSIAQATPEDKMALIKKEQAQGRIVAIAGDGTNDAPALAQADIGIAMNSGTETARQAGNMVDLDSDPTKLIEIVKLGRQLILTRNAITAFSFASSIIILIIIGNALFGHHLESLFSAVLSCLIFNSLAIPALTPIAIKGIEVKPLTTESDMTLTIMMFGVLGLVMSSAVISSLKYLVTTLHLIPLG